VAKRSELAKGMYVRMNPELDPENSYWERLFAGRYFHIEEVAKEPDDAKGWGPCYGTLIYWSLNYMKQAFNDNMLLISDAEQKRIKYIFKNKHEFTDLFKVARKLERVMESLDNHLEDCGHGINMWEMMNAKQLSRAIRDEMYGFDNEEAVNKAVEMWEEIEELLTKLDELEDRYIRKFSRS
jgi:hypothetical protein